MERVLIGRQAEQEILREVLLSNEAEMVAITGRRRVGKTYLVKAAYGSLIDFEFTGIHNAETETQLENFVITLQKYNRGKLPVQKPTSWLQAFHLLSSHLDSLKKKGKLVVFIDELPWLDTHKSKFVMGLDWFWNSWASNRKIVVVICGSAASWMIKKVINNRGGLHNRVTKRIHINPFNLTETEAFLQHSKVKLSRYHILQLYMALGGIPHYLKEIKAGQSAAQNINRICFQEKGLLVNEFENLYNALFSNAQNHINIILALGTKRKGLTRKAIVEAVKMSDGGSITRVLEELEWSGFISSYYPFGKYKKDSLYRLTDEYSLFYIKFIRNKKNVNWDQLAATQTWKIWSGYAFENLCLKHVQKIKSALGIASVYTEQASFTSNASNGNDGVQIDLLLDRNDQAINICEMKFYDKAVVPNKALAEELLKKKTTFLQTTTTRKTVFVTLVSTYGIAKPNEHSIGLIEQEVKMDDLF